MKASVNVSDRLVLFVVIAAVIFGLYVYAPDRGASIIPALVNLLQLYAPR